MRVVLVSCYDDRCYGLRCLTSHLRAQGHEVRLVCFKRFRSVLLDPERDREAWESAFSRRFPPVMEPHEEGTMFCPYLHPITGREWDLLLERISETRPELVGITLTTATLEVVEELTRRIHRELPGVRVVWGGIHPTICPEESLQVADMVCRGEGEHTLAELCADPDRTDIAGLWVRKNGEVIRNPVRPLEQDLDRFPFASFGENEWLIDDDQAMEMRACQWGGVAMATTSMSLRSRTRRKSV